ncbi:glucokinase [Thiohalobacter sp. COW1]|uniref:glucokinase n=1 Tax=Thiohalobacter sp. COW1 TaxID=2795687 RepID=UPI00191628E2|nr:glucokinase [Thiohalobacter sp. COW1]BCO32804.1 glucokinase [Thiohalobacter sp. COW1]
MTRELVLAGDIGGTHTRLVLAPAGNLRDWRNERRYASSDFAAFDNLLADYLNSCEAPPARACLAVAGPVLGRPDQGRARVTNLPWDLDSIALARHHGLGRVRLINDFAAVGHALDALQPDDLACLQPGRPVIGANRAVIGAGTGLGHANVVTCTSGGSEVIAAEAGHTDFAPQTPLQWELRQALAAELGSVSWEHLVSGPGLVRLYRFLCRQIDGTPAIDPAAADAAARITAAAAAGSDAAAEQAVAEFVRLYGAQAGNWALATLPHGGLYLAGGIAPRLLEQLQRPGFLAAFHAKGAMRELMQGFPVHIITHPQPGLLGALQLAAAD